MSGVSLRDGAPAALRAHPWLYLLGIGGPVDADGVGHVERFAWRFLVRVAPDRPDAVLAFTAMPKLMAFTRLVNARAPHAVSTEALRVAPAKLTDGVAIEVFVDLPADDFGAWLGRGALIERIVPELER